MKGNVVSSKSEKGFFYIIKKCAIAQKTEMEERYVSTRKL